MQTDKSKDWIEKAFEQFRWMQVMDWWGDEIPKRMFEYFKDAIKDNLPSAKDEVEKYCDRTCPECWIKQIQKICTNCWYKIFNV